MTSVVYGALALGCERLLDLGQFQRVECVEDACAEGGGDSQPDVRAEAARDVFDAYVDAAPDADASSGTGGSDADAPFRDGPPADVLGTSDAALDASVADAAGPSAHEVWEHWPMPNPDAAVAPDSPVLLPNPMAYDARADGAVYDLVTRLTWAASFQQVNDFLTAQLACEAVGMRVPTRIELVSLIDFTRSPTIGQVFAGTPSNGSFWTSSVVWSPLGSDAAPQYWSVNFYDGQVQNGQPASYVRCVAGGSP